MGLRGGGRWFFSSMRPVASPFPRVKWPFEEGGGGGMSVGTVITAHVVGMQDEDVHPSDV
ncbi:MAG: hypothetical protein LAT68_16940 [Cyclobacteriaceae bacterium]|nr:hypothetical protein [Cyclobacteriaceae bacterium]